MVKKRLTEQEERLMELVSLGYNNKEIGKRMYISTHSVKSYLAVILKKLGAVNRTQATYIAFKNNLIPKNLDRD